MPTPSVIPKAVILAGGLGTRLSEETVLRPKPMVEVGGKPLLWHVMKIYAAHGVTDFVICCGFKGYVIKEYFANYFLHMSDVTFDMAKNTMEVHQRNAEPWGLSPVTRREPSQLSGSRFPLERFGLCFASLVNVSTGQLMLYRSGQPAN
jgi:glucose-1-phosphate cytidylyltransferase